VEVLRQLNKLVPTQYCPFKYLLNSRHVAISVVLYLCSVVSGFTQNFPISIAGDNFERKCSLANGRILKLINISQEESFMLAAAVVLVVYFWI